MRLDFRNVLLSCVLGIVATSATGYERIEPAAMYEVPVVPGQIEFFVGGGPNSPAGLVHVRDESFLTIDNLSRRLVNLDVDSRSIATLSLPEDQVNLAQSYRMWPWTMSSFVAGVPGYVFVGYDYGEAILIFDRSVADLWLDVDSGGDGQARHLDFLVAAETLFYRDAGRKVRAISPDGELLSHEQALVLMDTVAGDPEETYASLPRVIEEQNRDLRETGQHYVIGGRYYTTEWDELTAYLDTIAEARNWRETHDDTLYYWQVASTLPLVGYDEHHNSYWGGSSVVDVFSPTGETLGVFSLVDRLRQNPELRISGWTLDPDGAVWALGFDESVETLFVYRFDSIADTGSPMPSREPAYEADATIAIPATATGWGIRQPPSVVIRSDPEANADEVAAIPVGTRVRILDGTTDITQIGVLRAPWYLIETEDGVSGWILGSFLERD